MIPKDNMNKCVCSCAYVYAYVAAVLISTECAGLLVFFFSALGLRSLALSSG